MDHSDVSLYVMTPEFGAATQLEKIDMLDFADVVAINKFDKRGAQDAMRDVRKQFKRNHDLWEANDEDLPVVGTIASQFNDPGTNRTLPPHDEHAGGKNGAAAFDVRRRTGHQRESVHHPPARTRYFSEIAESNRAYDRWTEKQADLAGRLQAIAVCAHEVDGDAATALNQAGVAIGARPRRPLARLASSSGRPCKSAMLPKNTSSKSAARKSIQQRANPSPTRTFPRLHCHP